MWTGMYHSPFEINLTSIFHTGSVPPMTLFKPLPLLITKGCFFRNMANDAPIEIWKFFILVCVCACACGHEPFKLPAFCQKIPKRYVEA